MVVKIPNCFKKQRYLLSHIDVKEKFGRLCVYWLCWTRWPIKKVKYRFTKNKQSVGKWLYEYIISKTLTCTRPYSKITWSHGVSWRSSAIHILWTFIWVLTIRPVKAYPHKPTLNLQPSTSTFLGLPHSIPQWTAPFWIWQRFQFLTAVGARRSHDADTHIIIYACKIKNTKFTGEMELKKEKKKKKKERKPKVCIIWNFLNVCHCNGKCHMPMREWRLGSNCATPLSALIAHDQDHNTMNSRDCVSYVFSQTSSHDKIIIKHTHNIYLCYIIWTHYRYHYHLHIFLQE